MASRGWCIAAAAALLAGTGFPQDVVVASKNFTESRVLGELVAALIEDSTGLEVAHRANLGGTKVCFDALRAGEVDLYVEYTGTAWAIHLKEPEPCPDPLRVFLRVQRGLAEEFDLIALPPMGFQNSYALAMREERAAELGVRTISDLSAVQDQVEAAFSVEFHTREDGYPGLAEHYGLELKETRALEHGLAYQAVSADQTDLIDAYTTDGKLLRYPLRLLEDDRGFFPPYHAFPLVRPALVAEHPEVEAALRRLAWNVDEQAMIAMNYAVEEDGRDPSDVAREFLVGAGLVGTDVQVGTDQHGDLGLLPFLWKQRAATLAHVRDHVLLTSIAVLLAALIAVPLGVATTVSRTLERFSLGGAGVLQTVPSLALLALLIPIPFFGLSVRSAVAALFLYALLPILRNTNTGLKGVDPDLIDAARGMGLTRAQILLRVQLPLAMRTIFAGIRTATVISIGVATLAAFIGAGGLGEPIVNGLYLNDTRMIVSGALPAAVLALLADTLLGRIEVALTPRGLRRAAPPE